MLKRVHDPHILPRKERQMKKIRLLMIFSLIICCLLVVCACDELSALSKPRNVEIESTTLTLKWSEVKDARMYTVSIEPEGGEAKEMIASKTSYSLTSLAEGKYTIRVRANGKDGVNEDSEWSEPVPFTREREPGMVFTLINNATEYEVTGKGIATGDIVIPSTYRGKPVTSIGKKAFFNKSDVTSVEISDNVKSIGDFAFANCSYLESVILPESLTNIGESAFASCRLIEGELTLPPEVTAIGDNAFAYCARITDVSFGNKVSLIGENAFAGCKALEQIVIPDSVVTVGEYAFSDCESVTDITIGSGLKDISAYAFSNLASLESITLGDGIRRIGEGAFFRCEALESVTVGSGIEEIDLGAFQDTKYWNDAVGNEVYVGKWFLGLKDTTVLEVSFREDTVGIANYAFYGNEKLSSVVLPNSVKIIGACAFALTKINNIVIGSGVEIIGQQAFEASQNLTKVILGSFDYDAGVMKSSSLKTIDNYAFRNCKSLDDIEIPATVKTIGTYAFRNSGMWENASGGVVYAGNWVVDFTEGLSGAVEVADGTVGIANYSFYKCETLTSIVIPSSVKTIGRSAFYECKQLVAVELPETLEEIQDYTFYHCDRLKLFTLPPMLRSIGRSAFYKCSTVYGEDDPDTDADTFIIPSNVEYIGEYAFYGCGEMIKAPLESDDDNIIYGIDIIIIGNNVRTIADSAFYGFVSLKELVLGDGIETIGEKAFYKCENLEKVTFGSGLRTIGSKAFYKCSALSEITVPDAVTDIAEYAFYKCESLSAVKLGSSVESIGNFAFYGCSGITALKLPASLTHIGRQAFRNCNGLTSVVLGDNVEKIDAHAFYGCKQLTIYTECVEAASEWDLRWNSSYRPVVWGCMLSEEKDYVVSFSKSEASITNLNFSNSLSAPIQEGYVFVGWSTSSSATEATYSLENLDEAPDGRRLYAVYAEAPAE